MQSEQAGHVLNRSHVRKRILELACRVREGHIPSAFSIVEILSVLYQEVLDLTAIKAKSPDRDYFILSKGHGSLALYAMLEEVGLLDDQELENFCGFESELGGHPHRSISRGIEASTGSLGHGFPLGVGLAISLSQRKSPSRVFVLVGDGECNEGAIWEAALLASHHRVTNLTLIVDYNHSGDRAVTLDSLRYKFESFGFQTTEVDGHDLKELQKTFLAPKSDASDQPKAIIAHTIKGCGVKEMENNPAWHHAFPDERQLKMFLEELDSDA